MTTSISYVLDAIRTRVPLILTGARFELPNPYDLVENSEHLLDNGWGVKVGPTTNFNLSLNSLAELRTVSIVVTRRVPRITGQQTQLHTCIKALLEDELVVKKDFVDSDPLGIPQYLIKIDYTSSSGIEFVQTGKFSIISTEITFEALIKEALSC